MPQRLRVRAQVLKERQTAEAARRGIDVSDLTAVAAARARDDPDAGVAAGHERAADMVPRFGSDLGFTSRGIQARSSTLRLRTWSLSISSVSVPRFFATQDTHAWHIK
jgi:hypothetical protein